MGYKKCSKEKENLLDNLIDVLDMDDIVYLLCECMKKNDEHGVMARSYDPIGGQKMVYFRMKAEYNYYLPDSEEWD